MADAHPQEGTVSFKIPGGDEICHTYYKIIGDLSGGAPPLVILHGGPGTGHEYMLPFSCLWERFGIPVIFYDQIGCGASTHFREKAGDEQFWQEELFLAELNTLIDHLRLRERPGYHVLGHSWGSRIVAAFAAAQPKGLQRLVIASGLASTETQEQGTHLLIQQLPLETQIAIEEETAKGKYQSPRMKEALDMFNRRFFVRTGPWPPKGTESAARNLSEDETVRKTIRGVVPLQVTGSFRDWTCIPRLPQITVPTLVYNGEFDSSHDVTMIPFFQHIPHVRMVTFRGAAHMTHLEQPNIAEKVFRIVGEFLAQ